MFEAQTYQIILSRMIAKTDEWAKSRGITIDTREGSLIRTALSPAALEMQQMYIELDEVLNESFADTQSRDFLIRRCRERGIIPEPATAAIRRGEFNINIPIGSRYSLGTLNYVAVSKIEDGAFRLQCETAGAIGNYESGDLIPIEYISGLTTAVLTEVIIPGEDAESTEQLRSRYFDNLNSQAFGGNIQDYIEKTMSLDGIGGVKVYPVWNGGGTVKLVIIDSDFNKPSAELVASVKAAADPEAGSGEGYGFAPIGHAVTVEGVNETVINITANITYREGWDFDSCESYIRSAIEDYLAELRTQWADDETLVVRISRIETRLLDIAGILDIADTEINGNAANLSLGADYIPVIGGVTDG